MELSGFIEVIRKIISNINEKKPENTRKYSTSNAFKFVLWLDELRDGCTS